jgi:hypothetical protein
MSFSQEFNDLVEHKRNINDHIFEGNEVVGGSADKN